MSLTKVVTQTVFDLEAINKGDLIWAQHQKWTQGKCGYITDVSEESVTVQYYSEIGSATNHFFIDADDVANARWTIRLSKDLQDVKEFSGGGT